MLSQHRHTSPHAVVVSAKRLLPGGANRTPPLSPRVGDTLWYGLLIPTEHHHSEIEISRHKTTKSNILLVTMSISPSSMNMFPLLVILITLLIIIGLLPQRGLDNQIPRSANLLPNSDVCAGFVNMSWEG